MGIIYKIVNDINDKVYIGQTIMSMNRRWNGHKKSALSSSAPLYRAMRKYGIEHFHPEIIEECPTDILDEREIYWIKKYNSYGNTGYNATRGGKSYHIHDPDEIKRLWDEGYNLTTIAKTVNACFETVKKILEGYQPYIESKDIRRYESSQDKTYEERPVEQYTWEGVFVARYDSMVKAARMVGVDKGTIWCACQGKYRHAAGYQWKYADDDKTIGIANLRSKPILQITPKGKVVARYRSIVEAAKQTGFSRGMLIRKVNNGKIHKGFYWKPITE